MRKLKAMHCYFGESPGRKCGDCCHLGEYEYHGRNYRKCKVYGVSHSEATDWARRWPACGQFGKPYTGPEVMGLLPRGKAKKVEEPMEGQTSLFEGETNEHTKEPPADTGRDGAETRSTNHG